MMMASWGGKEEKAHPPLNGLVLSASQSLKEKTWISCNRQNNCQYVCMHMYIGMHVYIHHICVHMCVCTQSLSHV